MSKDPEECVCCGLTGVHKMDCPLRYGYDEQETDVVDEDWLSGVSCNPNAPEECESCQ